MKIRVAIVEDNAPLRKIVGEWIGQAPEMTLVGAYETAEAAIPAIPGERPDVVLVDINLPGADGIECVRQLNAQLPDTQFVMVTVYDDAQRIFRALEAGATGYLLKRASRDQLLESIAEVRRGGSPMSAQIARIVVQSFLRPASSEKETLSPREREVLECLVKGLLYKEIARQLDSSVYTINAHIRRIYEKLQVHSRSQAVAKFLKH